jgi:urease accessory protein
MSDPAALLLALRHADGTFPSGGFAFSQGLEARAALAADFGPFDLTAFLADQVVRRWAGADRVALVRAHRAQADLDLVAAIDDEVEASTASEHLRAGSRRNGVAFLTAHARLATPGAGAYRQRVRAGAAPGHVAVVQGLLWARLGLDETTASAMGGHVALIGPATAAIRLGLVGAIEAQAAIAAVTADLAAVCRRPVDDDQPFSAFLPVVEIACARHATGDLRLFSN